MMLFVKLKHSGEGKGCWSSKGLRPFRRMLASWMKMGYEYEFMMMDEDGNCYESNNGADFSIVMGSPYRGHLTKDTHFEGEPA